MSSRNANGPSRRAVIRATVAAVALGSNAARALAPSAQPGPLAGDRVFINNEDSNTLSVIDPVSDEVLSAVNLTSFDEDARPPFRFVTGAVTPTHGEMIQKLLYHGAISIPMGEPIAVYVKTSPERARRISTRGRTAMSRPISGSPANSAMRSLGHRHHPMQSVPPSN